LALLRFFLSDSALIPGMGGESWDYYEAGRDAGIAGADARGLGGFRGVQQGMDAVNPGMRAVIPGRTPSSLGGTPASTENGKGGNFRPAHS
jgi:hypothetical protein